MGYNKRDKEKINIEFEDIIDEKKQKIVIDTDDLLSEDTNSTRFYPGLSDTPAYTQRKPSSNVTSATLWQLAIAGLIGGLLAWLLTELIIDQDQVYYQWTVELLINASILFSIVGGIIGAFLGSVEGITSRVAEKTFIGIAIGFLVGFMGGAVGGFTGQFVYGIMGGGQHVNIIMQILVRGFGWALAGLFIGLGQGLGTGGGKKVINGLLGGLIGGTIGGLLFDLIGFVFMVGIVSRAVAIALLGLFTGLAIGLVQEIRKEAWLKAIKGETAGKEYIIHSEKTTIGSAPKNDIVLIKDPGVSVYHAVINVENSAYHISDLQNTGGVWVNDRQIAKQRLRNGDIIQIGGHRLKYFEKSVSEPQVN